MVIYLNKSEFREIAQTVTQSLQKPNGLQETVYANSQAMFLAQSTVTFFVTDFVQFYNITQEKVRKTQTLRSALETTRYVRVVWANHSTVVSRLGANFNVVVEFQCCHDHGVGVMQDFVAAGCLKKNVPVRSIASSTSCRLKLLLLLYFSLGIALGSVAVGGFVHLVSKGFCIC